MDFCPQNKRTTKQAAYYIERKEKQKPTESAQQRSSS